MAGGTAAHDIIGNNIRSALRTLLRSKPCRMQGPDLKVKAGENGRYPDALIDCGKFDPNTLTAIEPIAVFEVLSKSTEWFDQSLKLRDYDAVGSIRLYVLISQDQAKIMVYDRDEAGRFGPQNMRVITGLSASIDIPELEIALPAEEIYDSIDFTA